MRLKNTEAINIRLPKELLDRFDAVVRESYTDRSTLIRLGMLKMIEEFKSTTI